MRQIKLFLLLSIIMLSGCRKDDHPKKSCCGKEISLESMERFKSSAYSFAYDEISANSHYNSHIIDESVYYCYLGKLSSIYNVILPGDSSYYELIHSTTVFKQTDISLKDIVLRFDSAELKNQFTNDPQSINNEYLKFVVNELNFNTFSWEWDPLQVRIWSDEYYNIPFLIDSLIQTPGIDTAYTILNAAQTDFNKIELNQIDDSHQFEFSYGWTDFTAQDYFHYWIINVSENCEVGLISEYGDDLE